jgi:crotonobetainyl-CoA:carnitine CoA-transferase CaiB-like acyl-CoA transferase
MVKGVAEQLWIDHETLQKIKSDIISCNTSMYGPEGPLALLDGLAPRQGAGRSQRALPPVRGARRLDSDRGAQAGALDGALGRADLAADERFSSRERRESNRAELQVELQRTFRSRTPLQ